jgi:hypothetical protein
MTLKSTRAAAERCILPLLPSFLPSIKERTFFTTKPIDRHASGLRALGETRATYNDYKELASYPRGAR